MNTTKSSLHTAFTVSIQALHTELDTLYNQIMYDKECVALYWAQCDVSRPVSTENAFYGLNAAKNRLRVSRARLAKVNKSISILKKCVRML